MAEKMFYKNTTDDVQKLLKIISDVKESTCKKSITLLQTQISQLQTSLHKSEELNRTQRELIQIQRDIIQQQQKKIEGFENTKSEKSDQFAHIAKKLVTTLQTNSTDRM